MFKIHVIFTNITDLTTLNDLNNDSSVEQINLNLYCIKLGVNGVSRDSHANGLQTFTHIIEVLVKCQGFFVCPKVCVL